MHFVSSGTSKEESHSFSNPVYSLSVNNPTHNLPSFTNASALSTPPIVSGLKPVVSFNRGAIFLKTTSYAKLEDGGSIRGSSSSPQEAANTKSNSHNHICFLITKPSILSPQLPKKRFIKTRSVEPRCPRPKLEVLRKPCSTDMEQQSHAYSVRTAMRILVLRLKFLRFLTYKISITLK